MQTFSSPLTRLEKSQFCALRYTITSSGVHRQKERDELEEIFTRMSFSPAIRYWTFNRRGDKKQCVMFKKALFKLILRMVSHCIFVFLRELPSSLHFPIETHDVDFLFTVLIELPTNSFPSSTENMLTSDHQRRAGTRSKSPSRRKLARLQAKVHPDKATWPYHQRSLRHRHDTHTHRQGTAIWLKYAWGNTFSPKIKWTTTTTKVTVWKVCSFTQE